MSLHNPLYFFHQMTTPVLLILVFISYSALICQANAISSRETLEIVIGGGVSPPYSSPPDYGDCPDCAPPPEPPVCPEPVPPPPPPPEPECPPPPPPPSLPPPPTPPSPSPSPPPPRSPRPPKPPSPKPSPEPPYQLTPELQRAVTVIQKFKKTIGPEARAITNTWKGQICKDKKAYRGFTCDITKSDNKTRVALVNFNGFKLPGLGPDKKLSFSDFLEGLTDLIVFHANTNNLAGQVPSRINKIPSLFELDLSNNRLEGGFPKAVVTATNLTFLDLRFNQLTGKVMPEVFGLDLDVLYLNNNQFVGNIPDNLGQTPSLYVTLANNFFTGEIPKSIGLRNTSKFLLEILLLNNMLSGCLPIEIGLLKKTYLFDASINRLTGPIPHSFGCLKSMQYLNISFNQLYGAVPEPLCMLENLVTLTLNSNYITEVGPACRKLIAKKKLDVGMNCILDLPSQRSPHDCEAFFLKRKTCRNPSSFNEMHYCSLKSTGGRKLLAQAQPRTYEALQSHLPGPRAPRIGT